MVTTRSANKQDAINDKTENLALRSKSDELPLPAQSAESESEVSIPSTKRRSKILVNVPPPRKRTRLSYDEADSIEEAQVKTAAEIRSITLKQDVLSQSGNEEPSKALPISISEAEFETRAEPVVLTGNQSNPGTSPSVQQQRGITSTSQLETPLSGGTEIAPAETGKHKRFDSEEPLEIEAVVEDVQEDAVDQTKAHDQTHYDEDSEDGDDAPEMETTKAIPVTSASGPRKKARTKKRPSEAVQHQSRSTKSEGDTAQVIGPSANKQQTPKAAAMPVLKIDTNQDEESATMLASEDSADSAFVTARTDRHVDVFATPQSGTPQMTTPTLQLLAPAEGKLTTSEGLASGSDRDLSTNLQRVALLQSKSKRVIPQTSSVVLPRKAGNTLENYRRQMLQNRAEKSLGSRRAGNFTTQEEWSGKRRKFVVGY